MAKQRSVPLTATNADKHILYQISVQDPPTEIRLIDRIFTRRNGRKPRSLREDFCGTALMCADWVRKGEERTATGIDLDPEVLAWARRHNIAPLGQAVERVQLQQGNVLEPVGQNHDVTVALNFSYCTFMERAQLSRYCEGVIQELSDDGVFVLDMHGGTDLTMELDNEIEHEGFNYVWDQGPFDAINGTSTRYIHFNFPDGSKLHRAFTYCWRLWTLQELRDILSEAGFSEIEVYWEGANEDGSGNGSFKKTRRAVQEECWIAYIAAWK